MSTITAKKFELFASGFSLYMYGDAGMVYIVKVTIGELIRISYITGYNVNATERNNIFDSYSKLLHLNISKMKNLFPILHPRVSGRPRHY